MEVDLAFDYTQYLANLSAIRNDVMSALEVKQVAELVIDVHLSDIVEQPTDHQKRSLQRLLTTYFRRNAEDMNQHVGGSKLNSHLEDLLLFVTAEIGEDPEPVDIDEDGNENEWR